MEILAKIAELSPLLIIVSSLTAHLVTTKTIYARFLVYFIIVELFGGLLKRGVSMTNLPNEIVERPSETEGGTEGRTCTVLNLKTDTKNPIGMPSGHTLGIFMAVTFWLMEMWGVSTSQNISPVSTGFAKFENRVRDSLFGFAKLEKISHSIFLVLIAVAIGYSRVLNNCHTSLQVVIGGILGILLGIAFYYFDIKVFNDESI